MKRTLLCAFIASSLLSSQAALFQYSVNLDGPTDGTPSLGTGLGSVLYDSVAQTLQLQVSFSGLSAPVSVAHIHGATAAPLAGTAGVAVTPGTLPGFPAGVTSGSYASTLNLALTSTYTAGFLSAHGGTAAGAEAGLKAAMDSGRTYWNIHSTMYPGGEIRGFLIAVPEPTAAALVGLGGLALARRGLRRKIGAQ